MDKPVLLHNVHETQAQILPKTWQKLQKRLTLHKMSLKPKQLMLTPLPNKKQRPIKHVKNPNDNILEKIIK